MNQLARRKKKVENHSDMGEDNVLFSVIMGKKEKPDRNKFVLLGELKTS